MLRQDLRAHGAVVSGLFGHDAISDAVRHFSKLFVQLTADCGCVSCQVELDLYEFGKTAQVRAGNYSACRFQMPKTNARSESQIQPLS